MRKDIIIFNFKNIPAGFVVLLLFFIATEWFVYSNRAEFIEDYWNKFLINEHVLFELPKDYDFLIMGDSIQKTCINPTKISDDLLNLGLPGGKPVSLFLMLERYLKKHKPPKAIFLYVDPEEVSDPFLIILRYFVTIPEFISIWKDLSGKERGAFIERYWASLDLRNAESIKREKYRYANTVFLDNLKKNHGYVPSPNADESLADDFFSKHKVRRQSRVSFTANDVKYLNKFMKLAASKNIDVIFLGFFLPKEMHEILQASGFNDDYMHFYQSLKIRYPKAYFVKDPILFLENKYFGDRQHVNTAGSEMYMEYFKNQIFVPYIEKKERSYENM